MGPTERLLDGIDVLTLPQRRRTLHAHARRCHSSASRRDAAGADMADRDYADGTVLLLAGGRGELDAVLASAHGRRQPVLVQYSAQWCGPCRMMTPVVASLALQHRGKLVAVKVDIESSAPNRALAASLGIQALPTFQVQWASRLGRLCLSLWKGDSGSLCDEGREIAWHVCAKWEAPTVVGNLNQ